MTTEQNRLNDIVSRTKIAEAKVNLIGSNMQTRATSVFAPNKYPAKEEGIDYKSIYNDTERKAPSRSNYHLANQPHVTFF